jgi:dTDP-4-amino-4,6-dideoxygalactose transaminase
MPDEIKTYPVDAFVCVSFHATKNFPIGEGGAVLLPRHATWARDQVMAAMNFGFDYGSPPNDRRVVPGFATNAKMDELHAALLLAQLGQVEWFADRSARIANASVDITARCPSLLRLPYTPGSAQSLVVVAHREPARLVDGLAARGFIARRVYHPFIAEDLLTYEEARMVALPSDCNGLEMMRLVGAIREVG